MKRNVPHDIHEATTGPYNAAMTASPGTSALQFSEDQFRTIVEQSPISMQIFAPDGTSLGANRAWERLWGTTHDQIAGYNIRHDPQLAKAGLLPFVEEAFAGRPAHIPPIRYVPDHTIPGVSTRDYVWVKAFIYPILNDIGRVCQVVLTHEDITEQKLAEEALRESETRFRAIFQNAPVGISLIDRNGRYAAVNPARQAMLGYPEAELLGKHYMDVTHPDDIPLDEEINAEARAQGATQYQFEKRFLRRTGEVLWARMTIAVMTDTNNEVLYSVSIAEDITAQKRVEEERIRLLEGERRTRLAMERLAAEREAILAQLGEGIILADARGDIVYMNEAALRLHGISTLPPPDTDPPYSILTMDGEPIDRKDRGLVVAALSGQEIEGWTWRIRRPDGTEIIAQGNARPVIGPNADRLGAVLNFRDITAEHDLERQKDDFLSAIAHDLRTPLTTVKGRVQILQRRLDRQGIIEPETLRLDLERIGSSANRMMALITDLLDVANIEIGRPLKLDRHPTDLVALAEQVAAEHRPENGRQVIKVRTETESLVGSWDPTRIDRVLSNLLSNALKYSPGGGTITLELAREGDEAVVRVCDEGIGIPEEDLPRIFDRFRRGQNVTGRIPGTGIGLAAVREIVTHHGGTVQVQSTERAGTTFTVRLPLR